MTLEKMPVPAFPQFLALLIRRHGNIPTIKKSGTNGLFDIIFGFNSAAGRDVTQSAVGDAGDSDTSGLLFSEFYK